MNILYICIPVHVFAGGWHDSGAAALSSCPHPWSHTTQVIRAGSAVCAYRGRRWKKEKNDICLRVYERICISTYVDTYVDIHIFVHMWIYIYADLHVCTCCWRRCVWVVQVDSISKRMWRSWNRWVRECGGVALDEWKCAGDLRWLWGLEVSLASVCGWRRWIRLVRKCGGGGLD